MTPRHDQEVLPIEHGSVVKTLAIRLEGPQHAQLTMLAQLDELSITAAIRQAIDQWIEAKRSDPQLQHRAEAVLAEIEQDATNRREAIAALLSSETSSTSQASVFGDYHGGWQGGRS